MRTFSSIERKSQTLQVRMLGNETKDVNMYGKQELRIKFCISKLILN